MWQMDTFTGRQDSFRDRNEFFSLVLYYSIMRQVSPWRYCSRMRFHLLETMPQGLWIFAKLPDWGVFPLDTHRSYNDSKREVCKRRAMAASLSLAFRHSSCADFLTVWQTLPITAWHVIFPDSMAYVGGGKLDRVQPSHAYAVSCPIKHREFPSYCFRSFLNSLESLGKNIFMPT